MLVRESLLAPTPAGILSRDLAGWESCKPGVRDRNLALGVENNTRRALNDSPVPKDIIVTTPEEIARRGSLVGSILRPALREGRVIFERS